MTVSDIIERTKKLAVAQGAAIGLAAQCGGPIARTMAGLYIDAVKQAEQERRQRALCELLGGPIEPVPWLTAEEINKLYTTPELQELAAQQRTGFTRNKGHGSAKARRRMVKVSRRRNRHK